MALSQLHSACTDNHHFVTATSYRGESGGHAARNHIIGASFVTALDWLQTKETGFRK
jgi:hypothetical protein